MDDKQVLRYYLDREREVVLWKIEGLSERQVRTPMTTTGTNLLGIVKHLATMEAGYFGECCGRPFPEPMPWIDDDAAPNEDMWATADESASWVCDLTRRVWAHSDLTIDSMTLDSAAHVPWWGPEREHTTLRTLMVHMIGETCRHVGQMDILREEIDGSVGSRPQRSNVAPLDTDGWTRYRRRLQEIADSFGPGA
ncbi:DinB family protein [Acidipropionibacterium jensenii]|uniref:DinB family protein n=1 Tax=Acidipropionibacterium jensenii TaxID=1749 RepID=A0A3Q9UJP8_9ACTN|nr:DinB family protein [Acidipropionibacterium jensenii]AZZ39109.1 DinB family protein [Acidipropionibacterium jensenii]AZZ42499.1 DinB family protein [Acidipropionibacterium jensenii]